MPSAVSIRRLVTCVTQLIVVTFISCLSIDQAGAEAPDVAGRQPHDATAFHNPFMSAGDYRVARQELSAAVLSLTYGRSGTDALGKSASGKVALILADDWAMVELDGTTTVYDFRLLRTLTIDPAADSFRSENLNAIIHFRALERWNRTGMEAGLRAAGLDVGSLAGCDTDTALGLIWPDPVVETEVSVSTLDNTIEVICDGRSMGVVQVANEGIAPVALWPTLSLTIPLHPAILEALRERGRIPTAIQSDFRAPDRDAHMVWTLISAKAVDTPFPLAETFRNATAEEMAQTFPDGLAALAGEAANGSAGSGPPQADAWLAYLDELARSDPPAAALALIPTIRSFPALVNECASNPNGELCRLLDQIPDLIAAEPALRLAMKVAFMDYGNPDAPATVLAAMQATRDTPHSRAPNLLGIYGVALAWIDGALREEAARQGFESDPEVLILEALKAFPYDPEYWFALAVGRLDQWDFSAAYLLLDTAMSLPMPEAIQAHSGLRNFVSILDQLRTDFPAFYLQN
jgi:hypothetical protein